MPVSFADMPSRALAALRELDRPLLVLAVIALVAQTGISIMLPLLPLYARKLGAGPDELGLLTSVFAVTNTLGQLVVGFLSVRFTARRMLPAGSAFYAASNALIATAGTTLTLIAYRGIAGLGGGVMLIAERLYLVRAAPAERMAFANGVLSAAGSLGSVMGPVLGGALAVVDLRIPFLVVAVTSGVATVAALFLPAQSDEATGAPGPRDATSADEAPAEPAGTPEAAPKRAPWPVLLPLFLVNLGMNATYGAWITAYGPLVNERYGWSPADVALVFAGFGLGTILLGPPLSRLADLRGRRGFAAIGLTITLGWTALLALGLPREIVLATSLLAGGGLTVAQASWFALLGEATGGGRHGRSFGLIAALSNLGIVVGAVVASQVWNAIDVHAALTTSLGFLVLAILALAAVRARPRPSPAVAPVA